MPETVRVTFQFAVGQRVRWDGPGVWIVESRRYTQRRIMPWVVEYGLVPEPSARAVHVTWAYEPDLEAVEETP